MRSMVAIALAFVLAAAPALQGQQTAGLPIAEQPRCSFGRNRPSPGHCGRRPSFR
jgi:hypothetical protein